MAAEAKMKEKEIRVTDILLDTETTAPENKTTSEMRSVL